MADRTEQIQSRLLEWSATELRDLPWRQTRDPWAILVSEVMLQQTQVARVIERYHEFLDRFPTAERCAAGQPSDVIALWSGLGFNRRAVNLWRAADVVAREHGGALPRDLDGLLALPGVGPYTARAILAFAYEADVAVLDTNVGRLLARWFGTPLKPRPAQALADSLVPTGAGWRWNQTVLDFASAICTKKSPDCAGCPVITSCVWRGSGDDPAIGSAGVTTPQSTFEGSRRQVRGRVVAALRSGPATLSELAQLGRSTDTVDDVRGIIDGLISDGLVESVDDRFVLPGQQP